MNAAAEQCRQIEARHPGYGVWVSTEGWWYATRISPLAAGQSPTLFGADPARLVAALTTDANEAASTATPFRSPIAPL